MKLLKNWRFWLAVPFFINAASWLVFGAMAFYSFLFATQVYWFPYLNGEKMLEWLMVILFLSVAILPLISGPNMLNKKYTMDEIDEMLVERDKEWMQRITKLSVKIRSHKRMGNLGTASTNFNLGIESAAKLIEEGEYEKGYYSNR